MNSPYLLLQRLVRMGAVGLAILVAFLWPAFLIWGRNLPVSTWAQWIPGFDRAEFYLGPSPEGHVIKVLTVWLVLLTLVSAGLLFPRQVRSALSPLLDRPLWRERALSLAALTGSSWIVFESMFSRGYQSDVYNIQAMMTNPGSVAIFGQRRLMVWPAMLLKDLAPGLSYIQAFLSIQILVVVAVTFLMGIWASRIAGPQWKHLGQFLMAMFLIPTYGPFGAHDTAIVGFHILCLLFLYQKQYGLFVLTFSVAILNHQNIIQMLPVCVAVMWGKESWRKILYVAGSSLAIYVAMRFLLDTLMPVPLTRESGFWWNLRMVVELRRTFILGQMTVLPWFALAALAWNHADPFLKRASVLLLAELGSYMFFGQFNEARMFNGFIPVLAGIFLCYFRDKIRPSEPVR